MFFQNILPMKNIKEVVRKISLLWVTYHKRIKQMYGCSYSYFSNQLISKHLCYSFRTVMYLKIIICIISPLLIDNPSYIITVSSFSKWCPLFFINCCYIYIQINHTLSHVLEYRCTHACILLNQYDVICMCAFGTDHLVMVNKWASFCFPGRLCLWMSKVLSCL